MDELRRARVVHLVVMAIKDDLLARHKGAFPVSKCKTFANNVRNFDKSITNEEVLEVIENPLISIFSFDTWPNIVERSK